MVRLSIVTATYNAQADLPRLIASLRAQTDRDFEWVVIDGGSTDGTLALLDGARDLVTRLVSEKDRGIYDALNKGVALAEGTYYLVLGADDTLAPEAVALYRACAEATGAELIGAGVDFGGRVQMPAPRFGWMMGIWGLLPSHSVGTLIRRSLHEVHGLYDLRFPLCADMDFLLRAYLRGARVAKVDAVVGSFGMHGVSGQHFMRTRIEAFRVRVHQGQWAVSELALLCGKLAVGAFRRVGR